MTTSSKSPLIDSTWDDAFSKKLIEPQDLAATVAALRDEGKTIATANGSFDLLHAGHLHFLHEAASQADCLIVALNTDESIKQYKSPLRPIVPLQYRLEMMAALSFVTFVTYFAETDPRGVLEVIQPDVHVNGVEYGEQCIEREVVVKGGGRVHLVSLKPGLSTSELIKRINTVCG